MLVGLVVLSFAWIRRRWYNFFYRLHIPLYITYLGLMFWHAGNQLDSWVYLWATLAAWLLSVLARFFWKWQTFSLGREGWLSGYPASFKVLPGDMTRVTVLVPTNLHWRPGQHCWLRIPHLSVLQNHPFTIANLPAVSQSSRPRGCRMSGEVQDMHFYVRGHSGLSRRLLHSATEMNRSVHLDGPHGGMIENIPRLYDSIILVAGGSGISACLPWIAQAARCIETGSSMARSVRLIWMVRQPDHLRWVQEELAAVVEGSSTWLHTDFYITDADSSSVSSRAQHEAEMGEKKPAAVSSSVGMIHYSRPFLPDVLAALIESRRVMIFGK